MIVWRSLDDRHGLGTSVSEATQPLLEALHRPAKVFGPRKKHPIRAAGTAGGTSTMGSVVRRLRVDVKHPPRAYDKPGILCRTEAWEFVKISIGMPVVLVCRYRSCMGDVVTHDDGEI